MYTDEADILTAVWWVVDCGAVILVRSGQWALTRSAQRWTWLHFSSPNQTHDANTRTQPIHHIRR